MPKSEINLREESEQRELTAHLSVVLVSSCEQCPAVNVKVNLPDSGR